ncbi:MAG: hypothetical protein ACYSX1_09805, partial [Planctomycetota bacterium]
FNPGNGGVTPGPRIKLKDARTRSLSLRFDKDRIALDVVDEEAESRLNFGKNQEVRYSTVPASAKAKLIWNENKKQWKIFYGFNGDDPTIELPQSKAGIFYGKPFSETTAVSLVVDHGSAEFDKSNLSPSSRSLKPTQMPCGYSVSAIPLHKVRARGLRAVTEAN